LQIEAAKPMNNVTEICPKSPQALT